MDFPSKVYVIYPLNDACEIAGAYVGMTRDVYARMLLHLQNRAKGNQSELHEMMRDNGFYYQILGDVKNMDDVHLEADWIAFFEKEGVKTYNYAKIKGNKTSRGEYKGGDSSNLIQMVDNRCRRVIVPCWGGSGVVWRLVKKDSTQNCVEVSA